MTAIAGVTAGQDITEAWGDSVATELNRTQNVLLTADVSKAASSWSDITGLTAPVVAGRRYIVRATLIWNNDSTGGIRLGFNHPGGTFRAIVRYTGETAADAFINEFQTTTDGGTGVTSVDTSSTPRVIVAEGTYKCTSSGTFALRYYRNGAGTATVVEASGFTLIADA
jgi:hypothetical protein